MKKVINARIDVNPNAVKEFLSIAAIVVEKSNQEKGCLVYTLFQGVDHPSSFFIYEEYENQDAVDFHNDSEHFKTFFNNIKGLLVTNPIVTVY